MRTFLTYVQSCGMVLAAGFLFLGTIFSGIMANTPPGHWLLARVLGLVGVFAAFHGLRALGKLLFYGAQKPRPIRDVSGGTVTVTGAVERIDGDDAGPVAKWIRTITESGPDEYESAAEPFLVRDPTGVVLVEPGKRTLSGETDAGEETVSIVLSPGHPALVRGRAVPPQERDLPRGVRATEIDWVLRAGEGSGYFAAGSEREVVYPLLWRTLSYVPIAGGLLVAAYLADLAAGR